MRIVKKHKNARFKLFKLREEAEEFAVHGSEILVATSPGLAENVETTNLAVGEKPSPFKGPKAQDLVRLRKMIEGGDIDTFRITVWDNPRYLVSSGDTPAILQVIRLLTFVISFRVCVLTLNGILKMSVWHLLLPVSFLPFSSTLQDTGTS
jgi:hypothetical protein